MLSQSLLDRSMRHLVGPLGIQLPVMTRAVVPEEQLIVAPTGCVCLKTDDGRKVRVERKHAVTRVAPPRAAVG